MLTFRKSASDSGFISRNRLHPMKMLKVNMNENFFGFNFEIYTFS